MKSANNFKMQRYYIYMLRCVDNSIYTGFTTDVERRFKEHIEKKKPYGKYTRSHIPKRIEAVWSCNEKNKACSLEYHIKRLTKNQKEQLIACSDKLSELLEAKLNCSDFCPVNPNSFIKECESNG